jgi:hypothetical protein
MYAHRSVYKGYAIHVSGGDSAWAVRIESLAPEFPLAPVPLSHGHRSLESAHQEAKREIDCILAV